MTDNFKFTEHLEDLRKCLIRALLGLMICVIISLIFTPWLFQILLKPYTSYLARAHIETTHPLMSLGPADTLQVTLKAAFLIGTCISLPWITYQIWSFVAPGLYRREKRYVFAFCASAVVFFLIGAAFAYFAALPAAISFFHSYTTSLGIEPAWAIANYFGFVISFIAGFGVVFEMPVAVLVATFFGITNTKSLSKYRKHAVIIIFIIAAIVTPGPDVASQLLMAIPMYLLYEASVAAAKLLERSARDAKNQLKSA